MQANQGGRRHARRLTATGRVVLGLVAVAAVSVTIPLPKAVAQSYPNRQMTLIVAFGAGGGADMVARYLADGFSKATGQTVIVENRVGANGQIASRAVATAPPDGYTILVSTQTTHAQNPAFYKSLPYNAVKDFVPVTTVNRSPLMLLAPPTFAPNSVQELIALARKEPGRLTFAHPNGSARGGAELFKMLAKVELQDVPYKTAPQALADLMAGRVDMMWGDLFTGLPLIQSGKLKALGVTGGTRMESAPEIPTIQEQGVPGYEFISWLALWAPANTPPEVIEKLASLTNSHVKANADWFKPTGNEVFLMRGSELVAFQNQEIKKWADIVKSAGIQPE